MPDEPAMPEHGTSAVEELRHDLARLRRRVDELTGPAGGRRQ